MKSWNKYIRLGIALGVFTLSLQSCGISILDEYSSLPDYEYGGYDRRRYDYERQRAYERAREAEHYERQRAYERQRRRQWAYEQERQRAYEQQRAYERGRAYERQRQRDYERRQQQSRRHQYAQQPQQRRRYQFEQSQVEPYRGHSPEQDLRNDRQMPRIISSERSSATQAQQEYDARQRALVEEALRGRSR